MNKTTILAALTAALSVAASSPAMAQAQQSTTLFVDVNVGAQTQSRAIQSSTSFPLYTETAVINAAQSIDAGPFFDISAGYRFMDKLGVALGVSMFSKSGDGSLVASIPSPIAFNKPVTVTNTANDVGHTELGTHFMFVYFVPVLTNFDVSVFAGPSFFHLSQEILSATVPAGSQTIAVATESQKGNGIGANAGINFNYMFRPNYGGGLFIRYAGAKVDLPSAPDVSVGGFQVGVGLRARF